MSDPKDAASELDLNGNDLDHDDRERDHAEAEIDRLEGERHLARHPGSHIVKGAATLIEALDPTQPHTFHQPQTESKARFSTGERRDGDGPAGFKGQAPLAPLAQRRKQEDTTTSPSVTLAVFEPSSAGRDWSKTLTLVLSSLTINLLLPFINGVMLGFGEIVAHEVLAVWGWTGARSVINRLRASVREGGANEQSRIGRLGATGGLGTAAIGLRGSAASGRGTAAGVEGEGENFWAGWQDHDV